jgi:hypothetical protein
MAGTLTISTLSDGTSSTSATDIVNGSARAWVNFNGTGTVAIRASYNVSSITDNGTGDYTVNFTNAMPDANYCAVAQGKHVNGTFNTMAEIYSLSASSVRMQSFSNAGNVLTDIDVLGVAVFR